MKRFSEQLQKKAQAIRLSNAEKSDLRDRVVSYMEYHPLTVGTKATESEVLFSKDTKINFIHVGSWRFIQGFVGVFALVLVSVSYLAERTVPGDSLYAVKVSFNEEIRSTLARSSYEKVVWETERLNRRIAEARLLASEGRLTEQAQAEVADAVRSHSENARREIAILKKTDKDEAALASIQLETTLDVQTQALASDKEISNDVGTTEGKPSLIAAAVADSKQLPKEGVVGEEVLPSYDKLTAHVESETTRAYELLKNIQVTATGEEKSDIERRLEDIGRVILGANGQKENNEVAARQELVTSLQQTQKLIVFMTNIGVRKSVTVEQIVPVTLTVDERNQALKVSATKILSLTKVIEPILLATSTAPELQGKFTPALIKAADVASSTLALLPQEESDLGMSEASVADALATVHDIAATLNLDIKTLESEVGVDAVSPSIEEQTSTSSISADVATTTLTNDEATIDATATTSGEANGTKKKSIINEAGGLLKELKNN